MAFDGSKGPAVWGTLTSGVQDVSARSAQNSAWTTLAQPSKWLSICSRDTHIAFFLFGSLGLARAGFNREHFHPLPQVLRGKKCEWTANNDELGTKCGGSAPSPTAGEDESARCVSLEGMEPRQHKALLLTGRENVARYRFSQEILRQNASQALVPSEQRVSRCA
jgi:hypothetical protein